MLYFQKIYTEYVKKQNSSLLLVYKTCFTVCNYPDNFTPKQCGFLCIKWCNFTCFTEFMLFLNILGTNVK
jgi:uncharacterized membrane protein YhdT